MSNEIPDFLPSGKEPQKKLSRILEEYAEAAEKIKGDKGLKSKMRELARYLDVSSDRDMETAMEFTKALEAYNNGNSDKIEYLYEKFIGANRKTIDINV